MKFIPPRRTSQKYCKRGAGNHRAGKLMVVWSDCGWRKAGLACTAQTDGCSLIALLWQQLAVGVPTNNNVTDQAGFTETAILYAMPAGRGVGQRMCYSCSESWIGWTRMIASRLANRVHLAKHKLGLGGLPLPSKMMKMVGKI